MKTLTNNFIKKVIDETNSNSIDWLSLLMFTEAKDLSEIPGFKFTLFSNEFHDINYSESYICTTYHFVLLILNETFISGKDGSISKEINIYISKDAQSEPSIIIVEDPLKTDLINSAKKSFSKIANSSYYSFRNNNSKYIMKSYLKKDE